MKKYDLSSICDTALRCKRDGVPLTASALRRLVQQGDIPACRIGKKVLLFYPNVLAFVKAGNAAVPDGLEQSNGTGPRERVRCAWQKN